MLRRELLGAVALGVIAPALARAQGVTVNDVTELNPVIVERIERPTTVDDVRRLVAEHDGPISIGGARHSQGGQIACDGALFLDMRGLDRILDINVAEKTLRVEAGASWRAVQEAIDPHDLSVAIMQSYANFTVGGSICVNCHGDYVGLGPMISSIRALQLVLADGSLVTASRAENPDLFAAAVGGYGGVGVIVEATLDLADNTVLENTAERMVVADYPAWHAREIAGSETAVLHYAILYPPRYEEVNAVVSRRTDKPLTVRDRLAPRRSMSRIDEALYGFVADTDAGKLLRAEIYDRLTRDNDEVVWRNYEAASDADSLEPASRARHTYVLQEYFVPVARYHEFVAAMASILNAHDVDILNVAIRHAYADTVSHLSWAPEEVYAFVLYYRQGTDDAARSKVFVWTAELIEAALACGGRHYLPYQIVATREQFLEAYPRGPEFFTVKARVDPTFKFRNRLWEAYYERF